jgi:hypothetical protein
MAISTIFPKSKVQGPQGTSKLVLSKKTNSTVFFQEDAPIYSGSTATYFLNPGTYGIVAAATSSTSRVKIYQKNNDIFYSKTLNRPVTVEYFTIYPNSQTGQNDYCAIDITFSTGSIVVNVFEVDS